MTKIDCTHPETFHAHGTKNAYDRDHCRCHPCKAAKAAYMRELRGIQALHEWDPNQPANPTDLVDAEPIRQHIRRLSEAGIGWKRVAEVAGVPNTTLSSILYPQNRKTPDGCRPPRKRVRRTTAEKILAVQPVPNNYRDGAIIPQVGTMRRLQALMTLGYSAGYLGTHLGIDKTNMLRFVHGKHQVTLRTARKVAALYEQLSATPRKATTPGEASTITRTKKYAQKRGYAPPLAWDNIDDPTETPQGIRPKTSHPWKVEDVEHLLEMGVSPQQIVARLGVHRDSIRLRLQRAHRADLADRFRRHKLDERTAA